jgi:hypothetical protein
MVLYPGRGNCSGLEEGQAMTSEIDVYRSAHTLIEQHGEGAAIQAAMEADAMLEKGDLDGAAVWRLIVAAVHELQREEPEAGEQRH